MFSSYIDSIFSFVISGTAVNKLSVIDLKIKNKKKI